MKTLKSFTIYLGIYAHYGNGNAEDGKMSIIKLMRAYINVVVYGRSMAIVQA
jgi:hypothetical protein